MPRMKNYEKLAEKTECEYTPEVLERLEEMARPLHHVVGLGGESGEIDDAFKKYIFYGKPLDKVNIQEEIGDCLWYLAGLCNWLGTTIEEEQERNIAKLKARYGEKFSEDSAINRDLNNERKVLEQ